MRSRRSFLRLTGGAAGAAFATARYGIDEVAALTAQAAAGGRTPAQMAADEDYWREIQFAFTLDRTIINLNNGNSCPAPTVVHEACKRYNDWANQAPVYHRGMTERNMETTRRRLAAEFGADPEEIAITRNSSESLQIAQMGLDLKPGDEVLTTEQDYGRMLTTWDQRVRRDKIKLTQVDFPVPTNGEDLFGRLAPRHHPADQGDALLPHHQPVGAALPGAAAEPSSPASRDIITIVDGAHAGGHFPYKLQRPRHGLLRRVAAQVAAGADGHRAALRAPRAHRLDLAAAGRAGHPRHRHPQVRGGRHAADRPEGGHQRGDRLPAGDRHRAQGGAPALPHAALGQRPANREADQDPLEPGRGPDLGPGRASRSTASTAASWSITCGTSTASSSPASATTIPTTRR